VYYISASRCPDAWAGQDFFGDQADIAGVRGEMVAPKTKREV